MSSLGEMLTEQDIALMMGEAGAVDGKVGNMEAVIKIAIDHTRPCIIMITSFILPIPHS